MARPITDEELQLKKRARRRLVGAIVLVSAVAVILPMLLDSEPRSVNQNVDIHIPSADSGDFKPKGSTATPGGDAKSAKSAPPDKSDAAPVAKSEGRITPTSPIGDPLPPPVTSAKAVESKSAKADPAKAPAKDAATAKATAAAKDAALEDAVLAKESAPKEAPAKEKQAVAAKDTTSQQAPSAAAGAYVVQVAALSDSAKARQLEKQMAGAGVKTYTEVVNTQAGEVTRVRAGPFATREAAEKARTQLKKAGLDGKVVAK
jgi:DedD protein